MIERDYIELIRDRVPLPAVYEQLAEECSELAHAALKAARRMRYENPTPRPIHEILADVNEEATDVHVVASVLGLKADPNLKREKLERWAERLEDVGIDE